MKKLFLLACLLNCSGILAQQQPSLIPAPARLMMRPGKFIFNAGTKIITYPETKSTAVYLQQKLSELLPAKPEIIETSNALSSTPAHNTVTFYLLNTGNTREKVNSEKYWLDITRDNISIKAASTHGLFNGLQTLLQLMPARVLNSRQNNITSIPQLSIIDSPRFAYRGIHLDVSRHFIPPALVKQYIDYLAAFKFNTFHWHLTDDQGWRIEIKKYPLLTSIGAWRNGTIVGAYPGKGNDSTLHGGYYTQEQIKAIVQYASERHITTIPEIEMPGHASAAIAAYPQLSCFPDEASPYPAECSWAGPRKGKQVQQTWGVFDDVLCPTEYTFDFLQDVLDEVIQLFPSTYIHIGGDECPKESWKCSSFCQQLMKEKNIKDEHALQSYFIQRIEKYLNSKGKQIIGWDEILEGGLAPNATVMSWRGTEGGIEAAKLKHRVIMCPGTPLYFNHSQTKNEDSLTQGGYNPVEAVYAYDPLPAGLTAAQQQYITGAQANLWTEYINSKEKIEYSLFPRMPALAEVLWTALPKRNWKSFEMRIPWLFNRLQQQNINYSKAYYAIEAKVLPTADYNGVQWQLSSKKKEPIWIDMEGADSIFQYKKPLLINRSTSITASMYDEKLYTWQEFIFNKATGKKITLSTAAAAEYPGNGAFTLVDGIQNIKGVARSAEFLGFKGSNCEAVIDLGKQESISTIIIHTLHQPQSWIWRPLTTEVQISDDGKTFTAAGLTDDFDKASNNKGIMQVQFTPVKTRYIKVIVQNWGVIAANNPGAGYTAWLFLDEIDVE